MKFKRIADVIDAAPWEKPGDKALGVLCGTRGNQPRYYVRTMSGPQDLVEGEKVWIWSIGNGRHAVAPDADFLEQYEAVDD